MDVTTMNQAIKLDRKIHDLQNALNCFEFNYASDPDGPKFDRTPKLILDVDDMDNGREQIPIPMSLSDEIISFLKAEIIKKRDEAVREFNAL